MIFTAPTQASFAAFQAAGCQRDRGKVSRASAAAAALNRWVFQEVSAARETIWMEDQFRSFRLLEFRNRLERLKLLTDPPELLTCWGWEFFFLTGIWNPSIKLDGIVLGHRGLKTEIRSFSEEWGFPDSLGEAVLANRLEAFFKKCRGVRAWVVSEADWEGAANGSVSPMPAAAKELATLPEGVFELKGPGGYEPSALVRAPAVASWKPIGTEARDRLASIVREQEARLLRQDSPDGERDRSESRFHPSRWLPFSSEGRRHRKGQNV